MAQKQNAELLASLSGLNAERERVAGYRARRMVLSSAALLEEQRRRLRRLRAVALAAGVIVLLFVAPLLWRLVDALEDDTDQMSQITLWAAILCLTMVAAMLVAGWRNRRRHRL